ncbi:MAG TPA: ABC transporter substrate-binding protein [Thermodesulfobacteriota bacterium]|nr:ABC transporter substrate-binding protein [Thermodesulfobacteriota bacterium]
MSRPILRVAALAVAAALLPAWARTAGAETTLEKINRTGTFTVGTRTGSPPFGYIDRNNQWVGFSIDLARLVHANIEKKLGKPIKFELKESTPATRIPLLTSGAVDLISGTMTITRARDESVDFSLVFFVTGAQFLVKKGSPIRGVRDIAGKRIGAQQGSTNERVLREQYPQAQLVVFPDQPAAFAALTQGRIDAYTNDGVQLAGLKAKAPNPDEWEVVGEPYTYEPYGMAMRENDSDFRDLVNVTLMEAIESGEYRRLYDKWFGPRGEVPYPLSERAWSFLQMQVMPR